MLAELQEDLKVSELFDALPESVILFKPVYNMNNNTVADFEVAYCNTASSSFLRAPKHIVLQQTVLTSTLLDEEYEQTVFKQCLEVWQTGQLHEHNFYNNYLRRHFSVLRSKIKEGVISVTRDRTEYFIAEKARQEQAVLLTSILEASADAVMVLEAIRNDENEVIDFRLTHCNKTAFELGKISTSSIGKTLLEILPHLKFSEQFSQHKQVIDTAIPTRIETTFRNEKGDEYGWFIVSLMKIGDSVVSTFIDISEKKNNQQKIEDQSDLLNSIFEASINGIFACDAIRNDQGEIVDFKIVKINEAFTRMTGISSEIVQDKTYQAIFPSGKRLGLFTWYCEVIAEGKSQRKEVYYDDERLRGWYDVSMVKRGLNGIVITFANITESKLHKQSIEESSRYLQDVIDSSQTGILLLSPVKNTDGHVIDFRFKTVNQTLSKYTGKHPSDLVGKLLSEIFAQSLETGILDRYKKLAEGKETEERFETFYSGDEINAWLDVHVKKRAGDLLITFLDFTPLKKLQVQLEASIQELKKSNSGLEEFAYAASHDLQEPLRKINFFSEKLRIKLDKRLVEDEGKIFERMESAAARMSRLIEDLLTYSQVSQIASTFHTTDLNEIVQQVLSDLETSISEKNASIISGHLPHVYGDRVQLRQLFQNILGNSIKYSKKGLAPAISITCEKVTRQISNGSRNFYEIIIADNGIGFEQEHAERIFKVFHRLHGQSEFPGTGIGLGIVKKVIENHQGFISAKGSPGIGSSLTILLPHGKRDD